MKKLTLLFLSIVFVVFFSSCASKYERYSKSSAVFVTFKFPSLNFKFSDSGFLYLNEKRLRLELYKFGQTVFFVEINDKICTNYACYDKKLFNQRWFLNAYYDDLLEDILRARPIYEAKNLQKTQCGFRQDFSTQGQNLVYELCHDELSFYAIKGGTQLFSIKMRRLSNE